MFTEVNTSDLKEFLRLVAEGEQDKAEAMLTNNPALALESGDVTDLSKRTFRGITGFQYAVWALDWHMWTMIKKYLPIEEVQLQAQGFETGSWVKNHGVHANLNTLIQAYEAIIDLYNSNNYAESNNTAWIQQVGGAQLLLPAHVINEYCHPRQSFYPVRNFRDGLVLPRTRILQGQNGGGDTWFTALYNGGKLGDTFAIWGGAACEWSPALARRVWVDFDGVFELASTRTAQREELVAELRSRSGERNERPIQATTKAVSPTNDSKDSFEPDGLRFSMNNSEPIARITVYSIAEPKIPITYDNWVVSIMRKPRGKNPDHAFLVIEGINQFGKGLLMRYDLVDDNTKPGYALIIDKSFYNIEPEQFNLVFCRDLMKQETFYHQSWSIHHTQIQSLIEDINRDKKKTIKYCISGSESIFAKSTNTNAHSCFTWAREKLQNLRNERIQLPESWMDFICAKTSFYINSPDTEKEKSSCYCTAL